MGDIRNVKQVTLLCGILSVSEDLCEVAKSEMVRLFGPVGAESEIYPFDFTSYYRQEMGEHILRRFLSFSRAIDPSSLADIKLATNKLERKFSMEGRDRFLRCVNLDPGYVTPAKLVLASTKDFAHRVYLGRGIYAEVTLLFRHGRPVALEWTYPDYRSGLYDEFLMRVCRNAPR